MVVAEVSTFPLATESSNGSVCVAAGIRELEGSGLKCTLGPMGTTMEAESPAEVYAPIARAQAAVFDLGITRAYTVLKMEERRDVKDCSAEEMVRSIERVKASNRNVLNPYGLTVQYLRYPGSISRDGC